MTTDDKDKNGTEIKKIDGTQPVVWTPEDASRFLTSAIHEAQRPLADALKNRPITTKGLALLVGLIVIAGLAIALILSNQLEKAENHAAAVQEKHDQVFVEKHELQAQHASLQDRLSVVSNQYDELRGQVETLRKNEESHKRTRTDLQKFRRHNEALRAQITGLEMEKTALSRQLDALKIMIDSDEEDDSMDGEGAGDEEMEDEGDEGKDADAPFDTGDATENDTAAPEQAEPVVSAPVTTPAIDDKLLDSPKHSERKEQAIEGLQEEKVKEQPTHSESAPLQETHAKPVSETSSISTGNSEDAKEVESKPEEDAPAKVTLVPVVPQPAPAAQEVIHTQSAASETLERQAAAARDAVKKFAATAREQLAAAKAQVEASRVPVADTATEPVGEVETPQTGSVTKDADESTMEPDKYHSLTGAAEGAAHVVDESTPAATASGDKFQVTSAAYGESLSDQPEATTSKDLTIVEEIHPKAVQEGKGESMAVEEVAESSEPAQTDKRKLTAEEYTKLTPEEFIEKIEGVVGQIRDAITVK